MRKEKPFSIEKCQEFEKTLGFKVTIFTGHGVAHLNPSTEEVEAGRIPDCTGQNIETLSQKATQYK